MTASSDVVAVESLGIFANSFRISSSSSDAGSGLTIPSVNAPQTPQKKEKQEDK